MCCKGKLWARKSSFEAKYLHFTFCAKWKDQWLGARVNAEIDMSLMANPTDVSIYRSRNGSLIDFKRCQHFHLALNWAKAHQTKWSIFFSQSLNKTNRKFLRKRTRSETYIPKQFEHRTDYEMIGENVLNRIFAVRWWWRKRRRTRKKTWKMRSSNKLLSEMLKFLDNATCFNSIGWNSSSFDRF